MTPKAATRQLLLVLAVAVPVAIGAFLASGDFFTAYDGVALGHRPIAGSDGQGDRIRRFVIEDDAGHDSEVTLPVAAFTGHDLPFAAGGVPPIQRMKDPPRVIKSRFTTHVLVEQRSTSLLQPAQLWLPLLIVAGAVIGRNVLFAGGAFRLVPDPKAKPLAQAEKAASGSPRSVQRPRGKGPPPTKGGRKRRRGRR